MTIRSLFTLFAFLFITAVAPHAQAAQPAAIHGMLFFGKKHTYISHLPMFHSPHNYQAIYEVGLPSGAFSAYRKSQDEFPEITIYTLVPEKFALPELGVSITHFKAVLYRGHFERGGVPIAQVEDAQVVQRIYFSPLNPKLSQTRGSFYFLFGSSEELYIAHVIHSKPSFDQILAVSEATLPVPGKRGLTVFLPSLGPLDPLASNAWTQGIRTDQEGHSPFEFKTGLSLYTEFDDLSE